MKLVNRPHLAVALLLLCAQGSAQELMLELVYDGIDTATSITAPPGESGRLFVTTEVLKQMGKADRDASLERACIEPLAREARREARGRAQEVIHE